MHEVVDPAREDEVDRGGGLLLLVDDLAWLLGDVFQELHNPDDEVLISAIREELDP